MYNSLYNDYARKLRDLKPCEVVNPYLTGKEVNEAYEQINNCLVLLKQQQSEKTYLNENRASKEMKIAIMKIVKNIYAEPIAKAVYGELMNIEKKTPLWTIEELTSKIVPLVKEIPMKVMDIDSAVNTITRDYQKE